MTKNKLLRSPFPDKILWSNARGQNWPREVWAGILFAKFNILASMFNIPINNILASMLNMLASLNFRFRDENTGPGTYVGASPLPGLGSQIFWICDPYLERPKRIPRKDGMGLIVSKPLVTCVIRPRPRSTRVFPLFMSQENFGNDKALREKFWE